MNCRHCGSALDLTFIDLGSAPPSNAYLTTESLRDPESWFPLRVLVCTDCWLVQVEDYVGAHDFFSSDYAYFSSYSTTWLEHASKYVDEMATRFDLGSASHVVEVAANDGYLLQYVAARGIPCLGVEPTLNTAAVARSKGLEIVEEFFGVRVARYLVARGKRADLAVANNVLAHVPDVNDFVAGFTALLAPEGVATFEFPHLLRLVAERQFDTIYHEHYSYLSLSSVIGIFLRNGLQVFDVHELPTHGGSLRVFAQRLDSGKNAIEPAVAGLLEREVAAGMTTRAFYAGFQAKADRVKDDLVAFLIESKNAGKSVVGYGAAAKGNTLINYAGIRTDLLECVVDLNPAKQGKFLPGSRIPVVDETTIRKLKPDYVLILPWNLRQEVTTQLAYINEWGGRFVTAVPTLSV